MCEGKDIPSYIGSKGQGRDADDPQNMYMRIHKKSKTLKGTYHFFIYIFFKCSGIEFRQFTHIQPVWDIGTTV